jgi:hypothetical protein
MPRYLEVPLYICEVERVVLGALPGGKLGEVEEYKTLESVWQQEGSCLVNGMRCAPKVGGLFVGSGIQ